MKPSIIRAGGYALAFLAVYAAAVLTPLGQGLDAASLGAFAWLSPLGRVAGVLRIALAFIAGVTACALLIALLITRRWASSVRVAGAIIVTVVLAELLKAALPRLELGDSGYLQNTYPSGHVAFTAVVAAVLVRVAPHRFERAWPRGAVIAVVIAAAVAAPVSQAHRASDSIGALLLVALVTSLFWAPRARGSRRSEFMALAVAGVMIAISVLTDSATVLGLAIVIVVVVATIELLPGPVRATPPVRRSPGPGLRP